VLPSRGAPALASCAWLFDLLFSSPAGVAWAADGQLPAGYRQAERFAVLRPGTDRSFAVSLAARPGTASALTSYNALRLARRRPARRMLGIALRTGLAQPLLRTKVAVGVAADAADPDGGLAGLLTEHLSGLLGTGRVVLAFGGPSGPYRKPVLQVFGTDGTPLGYVKVGWNDWTRAAVSREAAALRAAAAAPMRLGVPALLHQSSWQGLDLIVTAPLPRRVHGVGVGAALPDVTILREISELSPAWTGPLAASPWWSGLRERIAAGAAEPDARERLTLVSEAIEQAGGDAVLRFGTWHGDLVPWNLARHRGRLYAWDWEDSAPAAPVGFDALHFYFQTAFVWRRAGVAAAAALAARAAGPAIRALGQPPRAAELLATLHLLELAVRHEEARASTGDHDRRFYPDALTLLEQAAVPSPARPGLPFAGRSA
jgi:hypothetical protein